MMSNFFFIDNIISFNKKIVFYSKNFLLPT